MTDSDTERKHGLPMVGGMDLIPWIRDRIFYRDEIEVDLSTKRVRGVPTEAGMLMTGEPFVDLENMVGEIEKHRGAILAVRIITRGEPHDS